MDERELRRAGVLDALTDLAFGLTELPVWARLGAWLAADERRAAALGAVGMTACVILTGLVEAMP